MLFEDQTGRKIKLTGNPERILSLCPSQTELLFALGLESRIAGRTKFCIKPDPEVFAVPEVGGTKKLREADVLRLDPDLVICEKEENTKEMVEWLEARYPVFVTDVKDYDSAVRMVADIGGITRTAAAAGSIITNIERAFRDLRPAAGNPSCLYFIWRKPWMTAGADTFIHSMLQKCGFNNLAAGLDGRYPELDADLIRSLNPGFVFLSTEPYPFREKHSGELQAVLPGSRIVIVDGEMFSWYGSRMQYSPTYFRQLIGSLGL